MPDISNPFFSILVRGAETVARRAGYRVLLCNSEGDLALERQYVQDMIAHRAEGLIIAPVGDRSKANLVPLDRRKFPLVLIDRSVSGLECDLVQADSVAGAKMLTNHLLSIGHRRIAVIIEPDNVSTARERLQGYNAAMKAAGVKVPPSIIVRTTADRGGGYAAMQEILSLETPPTAVFAVNNMTALGAMQAIRERGSRRAQGHRARVLRRRRAPRRPLAVPHGRQSTDGDVRDVGGAAVDRSHRRQVPGAAASCSPQGRSPGSRIVRRQGRAAGRLRALTDGERRRADRSREQ